MSYNSGLYECPAPFRRLLSDDEITPTLQQILDLCF